MGFNGDDSSGSGDPHGSREAQLSDIRADVDEGLSTLQVGSYEVGVLGAKVSPAPEPRGHGARIKTHSVSGRKPKGDEPAQSGRPKCAR